MPQTHFNIKRRHSFLFMSFNPHAFKSCCVITASIEESQVERVYSTFFYGYCVTPGTLIARRCQRGSADRADRFRRTHRSPQQEELEVQMLFVLFAITLAFTLCWSPLQVSFSFSFEFGFNVFEINF